MSPSNHLQRSRSKWAVAEGLDESQVAKLTIEHTTTPRLVAALHPLLGSWKP